MNPERSLPGLGFGEFRQTILAESSSFLTPGIELHEAIWRRLFVHYRLLRRWNPTVGLIGRGSVDQAPARHYGESLAGLPLLPQGPVLDFGSGGGFPGLVLAACRPDQEFVLLEARERKVAFLRQAAAAMELPQCRIVSGHWDGSDITEGSLGRRFAAFTARAIRVESYQRSLEDLLVPEACWLAWGEGAEPNHPDWQWQKTVTLAGQRALRCYRRAKS